MAVPMGVACNTRTSTLCSESSSGCTSSRLSNTVQTTASRVLPMPMPTATGQGAPEEKLTRKAPMVIAGQRRKPHRNRAATERPEGNQTRVAKPLTAPSDRPSRQVTKYTAARVSSAIPYRRVGTNSTLPPLLCQRTFHCISDLNSVTSPILDYDNLLVYMI